MGPGWHRLRVIHDDAGTRIVLIFGRAGVVERTRKRWHARRERVGFAIQCLYAAQRVLVDGVFTRHMGHGDANGKFRDRNGFDSSSA